METSVVTPHATKSRDSKNAHLSSPHYTSKPNNQVGTVMLYGIPIVSLIIDSQERLCLAQISNTLLKQYSYNEIHNRRVALGITCVQCTPVQLEILRRAGAMPVSSRRCGMITRREAERLCKSFLGDNAPPRLPDDFAFAVHHECAWGCRGAFLPSRYNSSRAKCIKCSFCGLFFSPNKFIFHSHRTGPGDKYVQPDAANFNSWRRHMKLSGSPPEEVTHAWEDVKAMFNGGTRKRLMGSSSGSSENGRSSPKQAKLVSESPSPAPSTMNYSVASPSPALTAPTPRVPPFPELSLPLSRTLVMDYMWHQSQAAKQHHQFPFPAYSLPWLKRGSPLFFGHNPTDSSLLPFHRNSSAVHDSKPIFHQSAFRPVQGSGILETSIGLKPSEELSDDETVDIETTEDEDMNIRDDSKTSKQGWSSPKQSETDAHSEDIASSPVSVRSMTAVRSSPSPVALKLETDPSPPPLVNHLMSDDNNLAERNLRYPSLSPDRQDAVIESPGIYDRSYLKHSEFRDRIGLNERPDIRGYHRENSSPQHRLDYPRDSLWSVARLTLERFERTPDIYRQDIPGSIRSFIDSSRERTRLSPKISDVAKPADCSSCLACRPEPLQSPHLNHQTSLITAENNNKLPATP